MIMSKEEFLMNVELLRVLEGKEEDLHRCSELIKQEIKDYMEKQGVTSSQGRDLQGFMGTRYYPPR